MLHNFAVTGRLGLALALVAIIGPEAAGSAPDGDLLVVSYNNDRIARFDGQTGQFLGVFAQGGEMDGPWGIAVAPDRTVWVTTIASTSSSLNSVLQYSPEGSLLRVVIPHGQGGLYRATSLCFGPDDDFLVCVSGPGRILRFDRKSGGPLGVFIGHSTSPPGGVNTPNDIIRHNGHYYVSEEHSGHVRRFDQAGGPVGTGAFAGGLAPLKQIAFGPDGNLYTTVYFTDNIHRRDGQTGQFVGHIPVLSPSNMLINGGPIGLAFGPDGTLYVSNHLDDRVGAFDPQTGQLLRVLDLWNTAGLDRPAFIAVLPEACYPDCNADGALNLADFGCFQTRFALADPYADCNGDGVHNLADFGCFQTKFALGCP